MKPDDFEYIRVKFEHGRSVLLDPVDFTFDDPEEECSARNIIWGKICFLGFSKDLSEEDIEDVLEGDDDNGVLIGHITGCLVLSGAIMNEGFELLDICDCAHGDVYYTMAALTSDGQPLCDEPCLDYFYIHAFEMDNAYVSPKLAGRILKELPKLVKLCFHIFPDVLAFCPAQPNDASATADSAEGSGQLELSPEQAQHLEEYLFFRSNGYSDAGGSGVLYLTVGDVL